MPGRGGPGSDPAAGQVGGNADPDDEQLLGSADQPAPPASLGRRLRAVYRRRIGPTEQSMLVAWASFGVTFGIARAVTHTLRRIGGGSSSGGIMIGGKHLHHYNLGILALNAVGVIALRGEERHRRHPVTAALYGGGAALIVDELALLIDLEDVYWAKEGRASVDAAIGAIAVGGLALAGAPFWQGAAREVLRTIRR